MQNSGFPRAGETLRWSEKITTTMKKKAKTTNLSLDLYIE